MKTSRPIALCLVLLSLLFLAVGCQPTPILEPRPDLISWRTLEAGTEEARQRHLPVLIDFYSGGENCPRCLTLEQEVYSDEVVAAKANRDFVPVRIFKSKPLSPAETALSEKLQSGGECILAFLDSDGTVIKDEQGKDISSLEMLDAAKYLEFMDRALKAAK